MKKENLWTFAEFARAIGKSRSWITQLANKGMLKLVETKGGRMIEYEGVPESKEFSSRKSAVSKTRKKSK
jgi:hypothetical protein